MNPELTHLMARARIAEMQCAAGPPRAGRWRSIDQTEQTHVTLRLALPGDEPALIRLAELDSAEPLTYPVIVAESFGRLVAALSVRERRAVADPFEPTAALVELLRAQAGQLDVACRTKRPRRLARLRALLAAR
jgi:hypothetical protein